MEPTTSPPPSHSTFVRPSPSPPADIFCDSRFRIRPPPFPRYPSLPLACLCRGGGADWPDLPGGKGGKGEVRCGLHRRRSSPETCSVIQIRQKAGADRSPAENGEERRRSGWMMIATKMPFFVLASHLRSSSNNKMTGWISRRKKEKEGIRLRAGRPQREREPFPCRIFCTSFPLSNSMFFSEKVPKNRHPFYT